MDIVFSTIALALPVLLGGLWLNQFVAPGSGGRAALVWGNGTLLGLLLLPQLMQALDAAGVPLTFAAIGSLVLLLIASALAAQFIRGRPATPTQRAAPGYSSMPLSHQMLFILLLLLVGLRILTLGSEVLWRPLFPWDATTHWATKARVWFEYQRIVPFVEKDIWLEAGGAGVFTDLHPGYPQAVPLLQVWMNLALGAWNSSLMNLPWLLCFIALGAAFFGQLRFSGVGPLIAMAFTYLLLSMPLLNIHVALAGYADIFLGAAYCAGVMALHNWVTTRQRWQGALAIFFGISCTLIKDEGLVWSLTLAIALVVLFMSRREAAKLFLLFSLVLVLVFLLAPRDLVIAGHPLRHLTPQFHADGVTGIVQSIWLHDNWHLLGYLLLLILPLGLLMPGAMTRTYLEISIALGAAVAAFLFLFLFTGFGVAASDFTGVGRLSIQLAPALLFLSALLWNELLTRGGIGAAQESKPAPL